MNLPRYKGKYPIGLATMALSVPSRTFGKARTPDGKPALKMEEIAFNVFYPADINSRIKYRYGVDWTPRPVRETLRGYATFGSVSPLTYWLLLPLLYIWAKVWKIPAYSNPPLLQPPNEDGAPRSRESTTARKWPLVVFSHGLCGGRTSYSQFCGKLASEGYVVLAMEHRDLTGPMVAVRSEEKQRVLIKTYLLNNNAKWAPGEKPAEQFPLRLDQLEFRRHEVYLALQAFKELVDNGSRRLQLIDRGSYPWNSWKNNIAYDSNIILSGHSFGAATMLSLLSNPPIEGHGDLPVSHVMLLDPWLDPFPTPGPKPSMEEGRPPICVMISEAFAIWEEHFARMKLLVEDWKGEGNAQSSLITIVRSKHAQYSDFLYLNLFATNSWKQLVGSLIHDTTMKFITNQLDLPEVEEMKVERIKDKKTIVGNPGHLLVHVK